MEVKTCFVGTGSGGQSFTFNVGGPTPNGEEYWGDVKYIIFPNGADAPSIPGKSIFKALNCGMSVLGVGYATSARIGEGPYTSDMVYPQQLFSPSDVDIPASTE